MAAHYSCSPIAANRWSCVNTLERECVAPRCSRWELLTLHYLLVGANKGIKPLLIKGFIFKGFGAIPFRCINKSRAHFWWPTTKFKGFNESISSNSFRTPSKLFSSGEIYSKTHFQITNYFDLKEKESNKWSNYSSVKWAVRFLEQLGGQSSAL